MPVYIKVAVFGIALFLIVFGFSKLKVHRTKLLLIFPWIRDFKPVTVKFLGGLEFTLAILLVGPFIIGKAYVITAWTALAIAVLMVLAGMYHSRRKSYGWLFLNLIVFAVALLIAFYFKTHQNG